ncbi:MAG TPA: NapC/NirT family cytochrome c [Anaerolineaceae bacterium]|nr:NapC/NirT family cytochrome c [Anaerolineaceae bacterium]
MKKFGRWLKSVFFPPPNTHIAIRLLPFGILLVVFIGIGLFTTKTWEYTNSSEFCGTACHTMPPQYITHINSDHARVTCEECHLGRAELGTQIVRKIEYSWQTGSAMVLNNYHYPIVAKNMRPARDVCETCHFPQVFTNDTLIEFPHFAQDVNNTETTTYLIMKTGGGSEREGLGYGIHWHIENPVLFYPTDERMQEIPYIRVIHNDGTFTEYFDTETDFDFSQVIEEDLVNMDCMSCHNRTAHLIEYPDRAVEDMLTRGEINKDIPYIRNYAATALKGNFQSYEDARANFEKLIPNYEQNFPIAYAKYRPDLEATVEALWNFYQNNAFLDQKMKWDTHPDNSQHLNSPGCFRCHDGKHLSPENEAVRLECNLCHSIPVVSGPQDFVTNIEISRGIEPSSHKDTNWITIHHVVLDNTCENCHTMGDPGGSSDTSFCSNSGCHGQAWEYAGFNAPRLRQILSTLIEAQPTPAPVTLPTLDGTPINYTDIASVFGTCLSCHAVNGLAGVNLSSYTSIMEGGINGPIVIPGDSGSSSLVTIQNLEIAHFGQFTTQQLELVIAWIDSGASE